MFFFEPTFGTEKYIFLYDFQKTYDSVPDKFIQLEKVICIFI
uniref:Uncharacterized protein n=1 Tax=viral metagenome TaxID=1070528 RepID=A0A6C0AEX6_9ZZZZ